LIGGLSIGAQAWAYHSGSENWQSVVFTTLTFCQLAQALAIRSERDSLWTLGLTSNLPLLGAVLLTFVLQLAVVYLPVLQNLFHTTPLSVEELAVCCLLPLVVLAGVEIEKLVLRRAEDRRLK
jgi:Ca2+-transporting ATPase